MLGKGMRLQANGTKQPPRAWVLGVLIAAFWFAFVAVYLYFWETHPALQTVLNRISWSSADAVAIAAASLSLYTYHLFKKSSQSQDLQYLSRFVFALRRAGIEPEQVEMLLRQTQGVVELVTEDPDTAKRIEQAVFKILRERYAGLAKLDDEEMYETLRSLVR